MCRIKDPPQNRPFNHHDDCTITITAGRGTACKSLQRSRAVHCLGLKRQIMATSIIEALLKQSLKIKACVKMKRIMNAEL